jgi:hypothetical protein
MKTSGDRLDGCVTVRETNVTPFSNAEMGGCDVVYIREYGQPSSKHAEAALRIDRQ